MLYAAIVIEEPEGSKKCEYSAVFCSVSQYFVDYCLLFFAAIPKEHEEEEEVTRKRSECFAVFRSILQKFLALAHKICGTVLVQRTEPAQRKYKLCHVRGCRSMGPHQKLTQHLKQYHCMDDKEERLSMAKSAKVVAKGYNAAVRMDKGQLHSLQ